MTEPGTATEPVVIAFPAEFDIDSAGAFAERLRSAITPRTGAVVADLTTTVFCDSSGIRVLVFARNWAIADGVDLRLAVPPGPTLVVLELVGLRELFAVYPSVEEALAAGPTPDGDGLILRQ